MSLDDEKEVCRRGQLAPRPYWIILGTMSWLPFNRVTHFPSFQMWRGEKKILATDGLAECGEFRTTFSNSFPTLPFNFPLVFSSIFTRLSGSADRHLNRNRSMKRWYACNALRAASPLLHSDFEMTTRPNLRFSQIQPLQLRFNSFSIRSLPFYRQYIYVYILEQKRRRKEADEKHRDKRKIEEDVTRRLWCSLESTYNVGRWPAFSYIYIYKKTDYRKPRIKLFLFKVVG